jgi:hypothetical protein
MLSIMIEVNRITRSLIHISGFVSAIWRAYAFNSLLAYAWRQSPDRFSPARYWNLQPSLSDMTGV